MTKLSQIVVDHAKQLLQITPDLKVIPKPDLSTREYQLFWKYHGHFPQEFVQAIIDSLPPHYDLISYNHLVNQLEVCPHVKQ